MSPPALRPDLRRPVLYIIMAGMFAELVVRSRLVVSADAGAAASNIRADEFLFRAALASCLDAGAAV